MNSDNPLVSVVIPSKNRPEFVVKALESVFAQTYRNLEIIVVDDGSDVPLSPILTNTFGEKVTCLRHEISKGAPTVRNAGVAQAEGEYIAFLDDDDIWRPEKIEKQISLFLKDEKIGLVFCGESIVCNGKVIKNRPAFWKEHDFKKMLFSNVVGGTSVVVIKKTLLDNFHFDESLPSCQDWDLFLRLAVKTKFAAVPDLLVHRIVHGCQISSSLNRKILGREKFYYKHKKMFAHEILANAQFLRRLGSLRTINNQREVAASLYRRAFELSPLDWRNWVCVLVSCYFPAMFADRILSRYAVTKVGDCCQFH